MGLVRVSPRQLRHGGLVHRTTKDSGLVARCAPELHAPASLRSSSGAAHGVAAVGSRERETQSGQSRSLLSVVVPIGRLLVQHPQFQLAVRPLEVVGGDQ